MLDVKPVLKLPGNLYPFHEGIVHRREAHVVVIVKRLLEIDLLIVLIEYLNQSKSD